MLWHHHAIILGFLFALGACAGSFANVCIHRLPRGLSVLRPRSRCPACGAAIRARDNVPIVGWLRLRGRCRSCRAAISPRYALVEALAGLLPALAYLAAAGLGDDPLEGGPARLAARILGGPALAAAGLTATLIALDSRRSRPAPAATATAGGGPSR